MSKRHKKNNKEKRNKKGRKEHNQRKNNKWAEDGNQGGTGSRVRSNTQKNIGDK